MPANLVLDIEEYNDPFTPDPKLEERLCLDFFRQLNGSTWLLRRPRPPESKRECAANLSSILSGRVDPGFDEKYFMDGYTADELRLMRLGASALFYSGQSFLSTAKGMMDALSMRQSCALMYGIAKAYEDQGRNAFSMIWSMPDFLNQFIDLFNAERSYMDQSNLAQRVESVEFSYDYGSWLKNHVSDDSPYNMFTAGLDESIALIPDDCQGFPEKDPVPKIGDLSLGVSGAWNLMQVIDLMGGIPVVMSRNDGKISFEINPSLGYRIAQGVAHPEMSLETFNRPFPDNARPYYFGEAPADISSLIIDKDYPQEGILHRYALIKISDISQVDMDEDSNLCCDYLLRGKYGKPIVISDHHHKFPGHIAQLIALGMLPNIVPDVAWLDYHYDDNKDEAGKRMLIKARRPIRTYQQIVDAVSKINCGQVTKLMVDEGLANFVFYPDFTNLPEPGYGIRRSFFSDANPFSRPNPHNPYLLSFEADVMRAFLWGNPQVIQGIKTVDDVFDDVFSRFYQAGLRPETFDAAFFYTSGSKYYTSRLNAVRALNRFAEIFC